VETFFGMLGSLLSKEIPAACTPLRGEPEEEENLAKKRRLSGRVNYPCRGGE